MPAQGWPGLRRRRWPGRAASERPELGVSGRRGSVALGGRGRGRGVGARRGRWRRRLRLRLRLRRGGELHGDPLQGLVDAAHRGAVLAELVAALAPQFLPLRGNEVDDGAIGRADVEASEGDLEPGHQPVQRVAPPAHALGRGEHRVPVLVEHADDGLEAGRQPGQAIDLQRRVRRVARDEQVFGCALEQVFPTGEHAGPLDLAARRRVERRHRCLQLLVARVKAGILPGRLPSGNRREQPRRPAFDLF